MFDPKMTYWQSLRIVARGLIQNPIREDEWELFVEGVKDALYYGISPFVRVMAMILLPVSAPLLALVVQLERRKQATAREKAKREPQDSIWDRNETEAQHER